jgi:uncharacterized protein (TIGR03067 family)
VPRLLLPALVLLALGDEALIGTWKPVEAELAGVKLPEAVLAPLRLDLGKGTYVVRGAESPDRGTVAVDASKRPATMDITGEEGPHKGQLLPAIYELKGDVLKICYDLSGKSRPAEFKTAKGTRLYLAIYQREK